MSSSPPKAVPYRSAGGVVEILFSRCAECGARHFPASPYGCRSCSAPPDRVETEPRPAAGVLRNFVTVHASVAPGVEAPCIVGEIEIADGVIEEAVVAVADESMLQLGMQMVGVVAPSAATEGGADVLFGLRFVPAENGAAQ
jgi:uncharacterized OB-fold protein